MACGLPERGAPVPEGRATDASVLGLANERFFPAHGSAALEAEVGLAMNHQARTLGRKSPAELPAWQLLAISGGGENGRSAGRDFTVSLPTPFDPAYMRALFDYGYQKALRGYDWAKRPHVF